MFWYFFFLVFVNAKDTLTADMFLDVLVELSGSEVYGKIIILLGTYIFTNKSEFMLIEYFISYTVLIASSLQWPPIVPHH